MNKVSKKLLTPTDFSKAGGYGKGNASALQILNQRMKRKLDQLSPEEQKMRKILDLRQEGFTWKDVANCLGYSSSSGPRSFLNRRTYKYVERFDGNFALSGE